MPTIELYINHQLCEIDNPENFSVYLKRQLLNPAELSTKDAQRSYDITLPATAANNHIFGYTNIEEVKGKFSQLYDAQLLVNGVKIFDGKFKISEITQDSYKGNLGVPAQKSVKDIFGETMMNQAGEWLIPFKDQTSITEYNEKENPECFFPLVLYGLMTKNKDETTGTYSDKEVLDDSVVFGLEDFPPSINCLEALRNIFNSQNLHLTGSAFMDERLKNLYVSYKNPSAYQMPWNYGSMGQMKVKGSWTSYTKKYAEKNYRISEKDAKIYVVDLFNAKNAVNQKIIDNGNNIYQNADKTSTAITIPYSAFYKIVFKADIIVNRPPRPDMNYVELDDMIIFYGNTGSNSEHLLTRRYEVKVMKSTTDMPLDLSKIGADNTFYRNNLAQSNDGVFPKLYPGTGNVNFIDPMQNPNILCGLSFGYNPNTPDYYNPMDKAMKCCNPMAIKGEESWDDPDKNRAYSAVRSPGYYEAYLGGATEVQYQLTDRFKVDLINAPATEASRTDEYNANGQVSQIVWLEKGEKITIVTNSDQAGKMGIFSKYGWMAQTIGYELSIEAFQTRKDWLETDKEGNLKTQINWTGDSDIHEKDIDLIKFLPSNTKVDDWVENFRKTFNLELLQIKDNLFELNTKQQRALDKTLIIDLDSKTDVTHIRANNSLNLPAVYQLGFTIDKDEEGFVKSKYDDGGGRYETGSIETKVISQPTTFSYNWFKQLEDKQTAFRLQNSKYIQVPVISSQEVWGKSVFDYDEMLNKDYVDKTQRFWYKKNTEKCYIKFKEGTTILAGLATNVYNNNYTSMRLDYKSKYQTTTADKSNSILDNYFTLLTDARNSYTIIECYLSPDEYNNLDRSFVKLNGDLYYTAEIDGYDPSGKKKAKLKLIRQIL